MTLKKAKRALALLLIIALLVPLSACGKTGSEVGYRIITTLQETGYVMAFREGDMVGEYVTAVLKVLASQGTVSQLSTKWLGEDLSLLEPDESALDEFEEIPQRDFILGFDATAAPMSFEENGSYRGFDIDLAGRVCSLLGWTLKLQPINMEGLSTELLSGNVDAAWGGLLGDVTADKISVSAQYLSASLVLVARAESGIKSTRALKGKYLTAGTGQAESAALDANEKLCSTLASISRLAAGSAGCFTELDNGACDVILVTSSAAHYFMSGAETT